MAYMFYLGSALYCKGFVKNNLGLVVDPAGWICDVVSPEVARARFQPLREIHFPKQVIVPGLINSHSHAFQILLRGRADNPLNFRDWVENHLYPFLLPLDTKTIALASRFAYAEMVLNGITTVGEFHYLHNAPDGSTTPEINLAVIEAARKVGLRTVFLYSLYDQGEKAGQRRFREPLGQARANFQELSRRYTANEGVHLRLAPHSLHGSSPEAIAFAANWSRQRGEPFHIHLAEQRSDLELSRARYGATPLRALQSIGGLHSGTVIIHGCWLDPEECALLGSVGGGAVTNPASNMALGDGTTPVKELLESGVVVSLGTDGACANNSVNLFMEMRLTEQLQRLRFLEMGIIPRIEKIRGNGANFLMEMGTSAGARNLGIPTGVLEAGKAADFITLDGRDISLLPYGDLEDPAFLNNIINSGSSRAIVRNSFVQGRCILREGQFPDFDREGLANELQEYLVSTR